MKVRILSGRFRKTLPDLAAGLATFAAIVTLACGGSSVSAASQASAGAADYQPTLWLFAGALAALVAFNSAFFRHLLRAYAVPRRAARRRLARSTTTNRP